MFDTFDDGLNPRFVCRVPVFRDELDADAHLSRDRVARHVTDVVDALHAAEPSADALEIVRDLSIEFLGVVAGTGVLRIDVWLERLDPTTCSYGFLCSSDDGMTPFARGERAISRVDGERLVPAPWSEGFVARQSQILRALHHF